MTNKPYSYKEKPRRSWFFWIFLILIVLLIGLWLLGYGPWGRHCKTAAANASNNAGAMLPQAAPTLGTPVVNSPTQAFAAEAAKAAIVPDSVAPAVVTGTSTSATTASAPTPSAPVAVVDSKSSTAPEVNIYFNINKTDTPSTVHDSLQPIVAFVKNAAQAKIQLTGLHDPSGSTSKNLRLANERSKAVQTQLQAMGVADVRIEILTPSESTGTGKPSEARRVEVRVVTAK
jgi:outer membrane protein OmpA-like peptidoglycan-associated protein